MAEVNTAKVSPLIWVVLLLTVAFTVWTALQDDGSEDAVAVNKFDRPKRNQTMTFSKKDLPVSHQGDVVARHDGVIDWDRLERTTEDKPKNLFRPNNWAVLPKPQVRKKVVAVAPPPPKPKPKAPPVPFAYMGRLNDGPQGNLIYLSSNDKSYSVPLGKKINGFWRLDSEDDNALYFTYLPLNLKQTLPKNQTLAGQGSGAIPPGAF